MAVAFTHLRTEKFLTSATSYTQAASISCTANQLQLVAVGGVAGAGSLAPTLTGANRTWVQVGTQSWGAGVRRVTVFRGMVGSSDSGALTADFGAVTQAGCFISSVQASGVDTSGTNGSGAIVQASDDTGTGTAPSSTLGAFGSANNATFGALGFTDSAVTTAGSGFTLLGATSGGADVSGGTEWRADNDTSVDFAIDSSHEWGVVAVEVKAAVITADRYDFGTEPSNTVANATMTSCTVRAEDAAGDLDTSYTGNITVALTSAGGATLGGTLTRAAVAGVATFNDLTVNKVGTYTLTATGSLTSTESASFNITADRYDFGTEPSAAEEGAVISPSPTVRAEDGLGNLDTSYTGNVTVALTVAGGATLGGTLTKAAVAGVATFNDLTVDLAGTYTLTATGSLTSTESASFVISAPAADRTIMYARRRSRGRG